MVISNLLFFIIIIIYFSSKSDSQYARHSASSVLTENKLYFIGGIGSDSNCLNDLFYLDISKPLTTELMFEGLTTIPLKNCWSSSSLVEKGKKIYIYGGINSNDIYSFDISTQQWNKPEIDGIAPEKRTKFKMVSDNEMEFLYIFGGLNNDNDKWFNDMNILNTMESSWDNMRILGAEKIIILPYWADFTATMMPSGEIVYIGGRQSTTPEGTNVNMANMDKIYVFNTKSSGWNVINAGGSIPGSRIGHSAVLASDNRIFIYGGVSNKDWTTSAMPDLVILNVNSTTTYQWVTPNIKNGSPPSRSFHSAEIINNNMIIALGIINGSPDATNSLSILDISDNANLLWKSNSIPEEANSSGTDPRDSKENTTNYKLDRNFAFVLGISIGGTLSLVAVTTIGILLYKRWKASRKSHRQYLQQIQQISPDNIIT